MPGQPVVTTPTGVSFVDSTPYAPWLFPPHDVLGVDVQGNPSLMCVLSIHKRSMHLAVPVTSKYPPIARYHLCPSHALPVRR